MLVKPGDTVRPPDFGAALHARLLEHLAYLKKIAMSAKKIRHYVMSVI